MVTVGLREHFLNSVCVGTVVSSRLDTLAHLELQRLFIAKGKGKWDCVTLAVVYIYSNEETCN